MVVRWFCCGRLVASIMADALLPNAIMADALPSLPLCVGGLADALPLFYLVIWWMLCHRCHGDDVSSCRSSCLQGR